MTDATQNSPRIGVRAAHAVHWTQITEAGDIHRSRSFSTRTERDAFRGVLAVDPTAKNVTVDHSTDERQHAARYLVSDDRPATLTTRLDDRKRGIFRRMAAVTAAATIALGLTGCVVTFTPPADFGAGPIPSFQKAPPPYGFIGLCMRDATHCDGGTDDPQPVTMTAAVFDELDRVNRYVNGWPQVDDMQRHGREFWTVADPINGGDCEDLALAKRALLIKQGLPSSALLLAVVRQWNGDGHAVLVVRSDRGDYVLDNLSPMILRADEVPYRWIRMQSELRPWLWVNLDAATAREDVTAAVPPIGEPAPWLVVFNAPEGMESDR